MTDYLTSILNAFHDLLFVFTEDGFIDDYLTPNLEDDLILPKEAFLGKHHKEVLPSHVSKKIEEAIKRVDEGEEQHKFDYSIELKGEKQWYSAVFSKVKHGDRVKYLGVVRNITERKNQELLLRGILNTSPAGIIVFRTVWDSDETIIDFEITGLNKIVEELTGTTEQQLVGQTLAAVVPGTGRKEMLNRFITVIKTGTDVQFNYQFENKSDETCCYFCRAAKFKDGLVVTFLDITDQKETEEKLVTANEELIELNRQKDKLFSVIAHDLKNAVSGTIGIYDMIFEDYEALSKKELFDFLQILHKGARNATELLEDLLLWSRNQFQKITLETEKLNLSEITRLVFESVTPNAEEKGIELKHEVPDNLFVHADANLVKTILRNLITNGIKFSHPGGEIVVRAQREDEEVNISVHDEGVGIEQEAVGKILNKRTNFTTRGTKGEKGSGLGLDLCIDFVEKHGGDIWIESEPEKGSTFAFTLPADT